ncbi:hypothetical protein PanWU01x14_221320 [Parasponia andersonii]|uniref:Uncharacterized protein n=1 Tax=Parasponia andersonii TaxID=3476 RepID=A0A2P5BPR8_PARAD|nr:hypothetical protein PanWU01x14_221320 [Parasponia andersonii]
MAVIVGDGDSSTTVYEQPRVGVLKAEMTAMKEIKRSSATFGVSWMNDGRSWKAWWSTVGEIGGDWHRILLLADAR